MILTLCVRCQGDTDLVKKQDDSGDKEQLNTFQELAARYDFKDWDFQGLLSVRLHPHRGEIEHIEYVPERIQRPGRRPNSSRKTCPDFSSNFQKGRSHFVIFAFAIAGRYNVVQASRMKRHASGHLNLKLRLCRTIDSAHHSFCPEFCRDHRGRARPGRPGYLFTY